MENELQWARTLGIFARSDEKSYSDDGSKDGVPHRGMPIFARNKQLCQELDARHRKRKIEAEQDQQA